MSYSRILSYPHTLTQSHAHTHTITCSHSHTHTLTLTHTLTHSHTHTHTLTHSHSHTHTLTHSHTHTLTYSHTHTLTHLQGPSETVCDPVQPRSRPVLPQTWPQIPGWAAEGHHGSLPPNVGEINGPLVCMEGGRRNLPHIPPFTV